MGAKEILQAIEDGYASQPPDKSRAYIGASGVGDDCTAYLAYSLRGYPNDTPSPKLKRIFEAGHQFEKSVIHDLKEVGDIVTYDVDPDTGWQFAYEECGGHVKAHMDGKILDGNELRVLEIKSMNAARFKKFEKKGVQESDPKYYAQLQMMMAMSGIDTALIIVINKNTSEYQAEVVDKDDVEIRNLQVKVETALKNQAQKISVDETDWRCKFCFKRSVCWGHTKPEKECQSCAFAIADTENGLWHCSKHNREASATCDDYKIYEAKSL